MHSLHTSFLALLWGSPEPKYSFFCKMERGTFPAYEFVFILRCIRTCFAFFANFFLVSVNLFDSLYTLALKLLLMLILPAISSFPVILGLLHPTVSKAEQGCDLKAAPEQELIRLFKGKKINTVNVTKTHKIMCLWRICFPASYWIKR